MTEKCRRFRDVVEGKVKIKASAVAVTEFLVHVANCKECSPEYERWYYSPENPNHSVYLKSDSVYARKVEEVKKFGKVLG